jgi:hypothetical protein
VRARLVVVVVVVVGVGMLFLRRCSVSRHSYDSTLSLAAYIKAAWCGLIVTDPTRRPTGELLLP